MLVRLGINKVAGNQHLVTVLANTALKQKRVPTCAALLLYFFANAAETKTAVLRHYWEGFSH